MVPIIFSLGIADIGTVLVQYNSRHWKSIDIGTIADNNAKVEDYSLLILFPLASGWLLKIPAQNEAFIYQHAG